METTQKTEFIIEPKKLSDMLNKALIAGKGIEQVSALITPDGIIFSDISSGGYGVHAVFKPSYFKELKCAEPVEVIFTKNIYAGLNALQFFTGGDITVTVDPEQGKLLFRTEKKVWGANLLSISEVAVSGYSVTRIPFGLDEVENVGILPTDPAQEMSVQLSLHVSSLNIPSVEQISFKIDENSEITTNLEYENQPFTEKLAVVSSTQLKAGQWTTFGDLLRDALSNFNGTIWFSIYDIAIFLTQSTPQYSLMYVVSTL